MPWRDFPIFSQFCSYYFSWSSISFPCTQEKGHGPHFCLSEISSWWFYETLDTFVFCCPAAFCLECQKSWASCVESNGGNRRSRGQVDVSTTNFFLSSEFWLHAADRRWTWSDSSCWKPADLLDMCNHFNAIKIGRKDFAITSILNIRSCLLYITIC